MNASESAARWLGEYGHLEQLVGQLKQCDSPAHASEAMRLRTLCRDAAHTARLWNLRAEHNAARRWQEKATDTALWCMCCALNTLSDTVGEYAGKIDVFYEEMAGEAEGERW